LRSEAINLRHEAIEKDKIMLSLVGRLKESQAEQAKFSKESSIVTKLEEEKKANSKHIADLESALSAKIELHKSKVSRLEEKLDEFSENLEVKKEKREIVETERNRVQKNIDELRNSKEQCYYVATHCCKKLKTFSLISELFQMMKILCEVMPKGYKMDRRRN
jgi:predicted RNase H-like nuclease (RuvC/YqgF family)